MFDIYSLLAAGHTPEEIAAAFTNSMNEAEARVKAEQEAAAAIALETAKQEAMCHLIRDMTAYIAKFYPSFGVQELDDATITSFASMIVDLLDQEANPKRKNKWGLPTATDIFADFFKTL